MVKATDDSEVAVCCICPGPGLTTQISKQKKNVLWKSFATERFGVVVREHVWYRDPKKNEWPSNHQSKPSTVFGVDAGRDR